MKPLRFAALLLVPIACQSTQDTVSVGELTRAGDFHGALAQAENDAENAPDDEYFADVENMARVAVLMDEGRKLAVAGELSESLKIFFTAERLAPEHPVVGEWIGKVIGDLSEGTLIEANAALMAGELEQASALFDRALVYRPGDNIAKAGLSRTLLLANHRDGMSKEYYTKGLRSVRQYWLGQASTEFAAMGKYAPDDERAEFRREQVDGLLAEDRAFIAESLEQQELYHAARNEYRIALLIDGENQVAIDGLARMDKEVAAFAKLSEAERLTIRGDFQEARTALIEGAELSSFQDEQFEVASIDLSEARLEDIYTMATDAEADGRYKQAVQHYDLLLQGTGYYQDAVVRRKTLLGFIKHADRLYAEAEGAKSPEMRRRKLEEIQVFWPEYKNVKMLLKELK